jgi:hypothetical protein
VVKVAVAIGTRPASTPAKMQAPASVVTSCPVYLRLSKKVRSAGPALRSGCTFVIMRDPSSSRVKMAPICLAISREANGPERSKKPGCCPG